MKKFEELFDMAYRYHFGVLNYCKYNDNFDCCNECEDCEINDEISDNCASKVVYYVNNNADFFLKIKKDNKYYGIINMILHKRRDEFVQSNTPWIYFFVVLGENGCVLKNINASYFNEENLRGLTRFSDYEKLVIASKDDELLSKSLLNHYIIANANDTSNRIIWNLISHVILHKSELYLNKLLQIISHHCIDLSFNDIFYNDESKSKKNKQMKLMTSKEILNEFRKFLSKNNEHEYSYIDDEYFKYMEDHDQQTCWEILLTFLKKKKTMTTLSLILTKSKSKSLIKFAFTKINVDNFINECSELWALKPGSINSTCTLMSQIGQYPLQRKKVLDKILRDGNLEYIQCIWPNLTTESVIEYLKEYISF